MSISLQDDFFQKISLPSQQDFNNRFQLIKEIEYDLILNLCKGCKYQGKIEILLDLSTNNFSINNFFLDFHGKKITQVVINGNDVTQITVFTEHKIYLQHLKKGKNQIQIIFQNIYSLYQFGLVSFQSNNQTSNTNFTSSTDSNSPKQILQYLYSQGEVAFMHYIFPCFDQPNIKAKMTLTLIHPMDWKVVSNESEQEIEEVLNKEFPYFTFENADQEKMFTKFKTTPPLPSYLYSIIAGNYEVIQNYSGKVPMRIFYPQDQQKAIQDQQQDIFNIISIALNYLENYLKIPFPFSKYDQIFCSEFAYYAMENPGSTTIDEKRYLFQTFRTKFKQFKRALILVHELAHSWFGDLITPQYWNELWLKEGFATFLSYKVLLNSGLKNMYQDQEIVIEMFKLCSISRELEGGGESLFREPEKFSFYCLFGNYSSVTYEKAASVIQYMEFVLGQEVFAQQLTSLLNNFQFKCITTKDLMNCFIDSENADQVKLIFGDYVFTGGSNILYVEQFSEQTGQITIKKEDLLKQNKLRQCSFKVVIIFQDQEKSLKIQELQMTYEMIQNQTEMIIDCQQSQLKAVFLLTIGPIYTMIDKKTLAFIENELDKNCYNNKNVKLGIFQGIYIMQNMQKLDKNKCLDFIIKLVKFEDNPIMLQFVFQLFSGIVTANKEQEDQIIQLYKDENNTQKKMVMFNILYRYLNNIQNQEYLIKLYTQSIDGNNQTIKTKYVINLIKKIQKQKESLSDYSQNLLKQLAISTSNIHLLQNNFKNPQDIFYSIIQVYEPKNLIQISKYKTKMQDTQFMFDLLGKQDLQQQLFQKEFIKVLYTKSLIFVKYFFYALLPNIGKEQQIQLVRDLFKQIQQSPQLLVSLKETFESLCLIHLNLTLTQ